MLLLCLPLLPLHQSEEKKTIELSWVILREVESMSRNEGNSNSPTICTSNEVREIEVYCRNFFAFSFSFLKKKQYDNNNYHKKAGGMEGKHNQSDSGTSFPVSDCYAFRICHLDLVCCNITISSNSPPFVVRISILPLSF